MDTIIQNGNSITVVAILITAIVTGSKGMWQFRFQTDSERKGYEQQLLSQKERYEQQLTEMRTSYEARLEEKQRDLDEWKAFALQATDLGKRATDVAQRTVSR